jgi:hypothetical protein
MSNKKTPTREKRGYKCALPDWADLFPQLKALRKRKISDVKKKTQRKMS